MLIVVGFLLIIIILTILYSRHRKGGFNVYEDRKRLEED